MAKLTRVPAKVFASSAAADEIGQFGSAVAGSKLETADVATIQGLSAWFDGWSEALVSGNRYPALQEMNGLLKVLSYQGAYALQEGIPEYDSATTYYIGSIVKKTGTFELYGSLTNDNMGNALTVDTEWKFLVDLASVGNVFTASTADMAILSNNVSDANNDIDFSVGFCYDLTTNVKIINTALTKQLDAVFAEGTNAGGLDTGAKANSTWYHCFAISKADGTSDFLFSTSATTPTMPTGFINKRRIGSIVTNASGNIRPFIQYGDDFYFKDRIMDVTLTSSLPTTRTSYTVSAPTNIITNAIIDFGFDRTDAANYLLISSLNVTDYAVGSAYNSNPSPTIQDTQYTVAYGRVNVLTNTSNQIGVRFNNNAGTFAMQCIGYIDKRGVN